MKVGDKVRHKKRMTQKPGEITHFTKNHKGVYVVWEDKGWGGPYKLDVIELVKT